MTYDDDSDLFGIETRYRRIETERLTGEDYENCLDPPDGSAPDNMEPAFRLIAAMFGDGTAAELDAESVLYNIVGAFNRPLTQLHRAHGEACSTLRDLVDRGDSSEVGSVRLEQAERRAHLLDQRIEHLEAIRDIASRCYEDAIGRAWTPPKGSVPSRSGQIASARSARQYLAASRAKELAALAPEGERFAVMGAPEITDEALITQALDDLRTQHLDMILVHAGDRNNPIDNIAARWARRCNVHQIPMGQPANATDCEGPAVLALVDTTTAYDDQDREQIMPAIDDIIRSLTPGDRLTIRTVRDAPSASRLLLDDCVPATVVFTWSLDGVWTWLTSNPSTTRTARAEFRTAVRDALLPELRQHGDAPATALIDTLVHVTAEIDRLRSVWLFSDLLESVSVPTEVLLSRSDGLILSGGSASALAGVDVHVAGIGRFHDRHRRSLTSHEYGFLIGSWTAFVRNAGGELHVAD